MLTNAIIFGTADTICQKFIEKKGTNKSLDYKRLLTIVLFGSVYAAPIGHLWYCKWAPKAMSAITTNKKIQPVVAMAMDQLMFTPPLMFSFLFFNEYLKNFNTKQAMQHVKNKMWTGLKTNWKVWPPIQLLNFTVIPSQLRVPFVNFVGLFWTIYLSYLQNN